MAFYENETKDLELHVSICQERYQGLADKFTGLTARMDQLESKVDALGSSISKHTNSISSVIIGSTGTIVVAIIGLIATLLTK